MINVLATVARRTGRASTTFLCLVLLAFGLLIGVPTLFGYQTYAITTGSMTGTADPGSLVIAEEVPVEDLAVGDVITYLPPAESNLDHPVTHRLVEIEVQEDGTRLMRTKGDANDGPDPWTFVLDGTFQPRMSVALPYAGVPVLAMADRDVRMTVIGIPAGIIALLSLAEIVKVLRDPTEDGAADADHPEGSPEPAGDDELVLIDLGASVDA